MTEKEEVSTLTSTQKIPDVDRDTAILLALSEHYSLTIKQVMWLYEWKSYPKATIAFKKLVDAGLIYRKRRHSLGKEAIEGDAYLLLTAGAKKLRESQFSPTFSIEPKQAQRVSIVPLTHTLLVNSVLIELYRFQRAHPNRFRIEYLEHERVMRKKYGNTFELYMDGFVRPLVYLGKRWLPMPFFLEIEHTSARDKQNWQNKVRHYLTLFENNLQTYFETTAAFVLVIITNPEYVRHLQQWTEDVLEQMQKEEYRTWVCIGSLDLILTPAEFFCSRRFLKPFDKAPHEVFDGLALINR